MQQLMLLHSLSEPDSDLLVSQFVYEVSGDLNVSNFQLAWESAVRRHDALRTAFLWDGLPHAVQVVRQEVELEFSINEFGAAPESDPDAWLQRFLDDDRAAGFSLTQAPLLRLSLLRSGEAVDRLVWTCHHLILDRRCFQPILDDVLEAYEALAQGRDPSPPPAPQFGAFIRWIGGQDSASAQNFWSEHLAQLSSRTLLFGAAGKKAGGGRRSETQAVVAGEEYESLRRSCRDARITAGTAVQGALALLLAGPDGAEAVFGLSLSDRPVTLPDAASMVGCFVNNLPVRIKVQGDVSVRDWLLEIQSTQAKRSGHEYVSIADIRRFARVPDGSQLFDVLLLFAGEEPALRRAGGVELRGLSGSLDSAYPLLLAVVEERNQLLLKAVYDSSLVTEGGASRILEALRDKLLQVAGGYSGQVQDLRADFSLREAVDLQPARTADAPRSNGRPAASPRSELEWRLALARSEVLGVSRFDIHADFFDLGGDSIAAVGFLAAIERVTGKTLPPAAVIEHRTIAALAKFIEGDGVSITSPLIVPFELRGEGPPVFVYEADSGLHFARAANPPRPTYGMIARHTIPRPIGAARAEDIAAEYVAEIQRIYPEGPIILAGYCYAGVMVLEMAQQLSRVGREPRLVVAVETSFPMPLKSYIGYLVRYRVASWARRLVRDPSAIWLIGPFVGREVFSRLARFRPRKPPPAGLLRGWPDDLMRRLDAEMSAAVARYQPKPYSGAVVAIFGKETAAESANPRVASWKTIGADRCLPINAPFDNHEIMARDHIEFVAKAVRDFELAYPVEGPT